MTTNENKNTNNTNEINGTAEKKTNTKKAIGVVAVATVTVAAVLVSMLCSCNKSTASTPDEVVIGTSVQTVTQIVTDSQGNTHIEEETKVVEIKQTQPVEKSESATEANAQNVAKTDNKQNNGSQSNNSNSSQTNNNSNTGQTSKPSGGSSSSNSNTTATSKPSTPQATQATTSNPNAGKTWHEAVYEEVYHPAETEQVWVPYYIDAPICESHRASICNTCGEEITGNTGPHMEAHMMNGENGSYRIETVKEVVGYEQMEVPELGYYETKVVKEGYTEKKLVREAGWY